MTEKNGNILHLSVHVVDPIKSGMWQWTAEAFTAIEIIGRNSDQSSPNQVQS